MPNNKKAFPYEESYNHQGMDLRDYFAARAMQAYIQVGAYLSVTDDRLRDELLATGAYEIADAMLKVRE